MIYPTINDLSKGEYNRYEIALATAKCARMITNEYVRQRQEAETAAAGTKEGEKSIVAMIDREVRDEKAVKIAIGRIHRGDYAIVHKDPEEQAREERAILEGMMQPSEPYFFGSDMADDEDEDGEDVDDAEETDTIDESDESSAEDDIDQDQDEDA